MGASGLAAGLLVALAALVLLGLAVLGMGLLLAGGLSRRPGGRPLVWAGASMLAVVAAVAIAVVVWVGLTSDPDTLELDLREPVTAASLDKEQMPGFPGVYDYGSDRVELVLPDGTELSSDADAVTVWTDEDVVTSVKVNRRTTSQGEAVDVVRAWADDLDLETPGLDSDGDLPWSTTQPAGGAEVTLSLQPVPDGRAKPFLSIDVSRTDAAP
ncbi:hypothetical protein [Mumia sp. Pv 4-285]|uniref:hypothetical protein n=1 Tax=Mumia qirimensis TaxID=3234852 RepID=UPI00351DA0F5